MSARDGYRAEIKTCSVVTIPPHLSNTFANASLPVGVQIANFALLYPSLLISHPVQ